METVYYSQNILGYSSSVILFHILDKKKIHIKI